ncbi:MAG: chemotaxis protein, partial [Devosia sp.]|nr:chemotaxis protein [Devosia sp.]
MSTLAPAAASKQRQLTVLLGGQSYTLAGDSVIEVLRRPRVTRVPHGPPALLGVSNLRGAVLPIVSLAALMGQEPGSEERVVVLDHGGAVGLLVDAVLRLDWGGEAEAGGQIEVAALLETGFRRQESQGAARRQVAESAQPVAEPQVAQRVLLSFLVRGQAFALPLDVVTEVLRLPEVLAQVGGADAAVLGLANVRERTLPILSLAALLGFEGGQGEPPDSRVLVVDHAGAQIGLTVDTVQSILRLPESAIDAVPPVLQRGRGQAELDAIGRPGEGRPLVSILSAGGLFANQFVAATLAAAGGKTGIMDEQGTTGAQEQFVVFELGEERYGLPIGAVQEVLRLPNTITRLPNAPRFLTGVINLRGRPVPIIDQRERFDAPSAPGTVQPRVIIVTVGKLQAGLVVDAVTEILSVPTTD